MSLDKQQQADFFVMAAPSNGGIIIPVCAFSTEARALEEADRRNKATGDNRHYVQEVLLDIEKVRAFEVAINMVTGDITVDTSNSNPSTGIVYRMINGGVNAVMIVNEETPYRAAVLAKSMLVQKINTHWTLIEAWGKDK